MINGKFALPSKSLKIYERDCQQYFILLFKSLLAVKNGHILARVYIIFPKKVLYQTLKAFNTKFGLQWKDRQSS